MDLDKTEKCFYCGCPRGYSGHTKAQCLYPRWLVAINDKLYSIDREIEKK